MRICIVGAGAIGSLLGTRLALAGHEVTVVDRGMQLEAIRSRGLTLIEADGQRAHAAEIRATDNCADAGPQDYVFLAVKAHQIAPLAPGIPYLFGEHTAVVTVQNGLPWWYFQNCPGQFAGRSLRSLDPDGVIAAHLPAGRIIGCVAYPAAAVTEPGVTRLIEGNRFTLGELDGSTSARCKALAEALLGAGFKSFVIDDIRAEIWLKAWGALSFNTISALTGATMEQICRVPATRELVTAMMTEAGNVAAALDVTLRLTIEKRIEGAGKVGAHKTSMLQDVEAGRELEIEAVIGSIVELAELTGTPVPNIRAIHACCTLLDARLREGARPGS